MAQERKAGDSASTRLEGAGRSPVPAAKKDDIEDVAWALQTAAATWSRGDHHDALKWIRRAAEAASEAEKDDRALELAKAAADVASLMADRPTAIAPPPVVRADPATPSPRSSRGSREGALPPSPLRPRRAARQGGGPTPPRK